LTCFICIFASCPADIPDNTVTIRGTVTVTRNGVPWNVDNFPQNSNNEYPFPTDRPEIIAFTTDRKYYNDVQDAVWDNPQVYIGVNYAHQKQNTVDINNGTYKWALEVPSDKLPCMIYFEVRCWMEYAPFQGEKRAKGIWVTKENINIDLGHFNYNVIQVSGNFPITINGDSLNIDTDWAEMYIRHRYGTSLYGDESPIWIYPNGDWSFYVVEQGWPMPLRFRVQAGRKNAIFRLELTGDEYTPDELIWVHDTDTVITFPSHSSIDFKAVTLSGTVKLNAPKGQPLMYGLYFYEEDYVWYSLIGGVEEYLPIIQYDGDGLIIEWETMLPAPLPQKLPFIFDASTPSGARFNTDSSIEITEDTDLNNIYLGFFTLE
jgi:hypothetical protein